MVKGQLKRMLSHGLSLDIVTETEEGKVSVLVAVLVSIF